MPAQDWRPSSLSPDLERSAVATTHASARDSIASAFGVLPALFANSAAGPLVREAQRHLCQWTLQPIAELIEEEVEAKMGGDVSIDTMRPLHAWDAGGRARAMLTVVQALAMAKQGEVNQGDIDKALELVDWGD